MSRDVFRVSCSVNGPHATRNTAGATVQTPHASRLTPHLHAFTLIELMIVVAIMGVVMAVGVPAFVRARHNTGIRKAVTALMEACHEARANAILRGMPMEVVIIAEDGRVEVRPAGAVKQTEAQPGEETSAGPAEPAPAALKASPVRHIPEDVAIELLDVNFINQMEFPEAHVRFYPNGTSDEFTLIFLWNQRQRAKISLEVVTGLAEVDYL